MSWLVETILLNRDKIRSSVYNSSTNDYDGLYYYLDEVLSIDDDDEESVYGMPYSTLDLDSDVYNTLLSIEIKISEMASNGSILPFEVSLLNYVLTNRTYTELENILGISRNTISKYFRSICDRVSFSMGGDFTDDGYLMHMKNKYKLTEEQVQLMRDHINSRYRHTIRRSVYD